MDVGGTAIENDGIANRDRLGVALREAGRLEGAAGRVDGIAQHRPDLDDARDLPAPLHAISGSRDGQYIVAAGYGYTEIESRDAGASWRVNCGSDYVSKPFSEFGSVWVQDATTAPFMAAGNAPYVVRSISGCGGPGQSIETWEQLPYIGLGDAAAGIERRHQHPLPQQW